MPVYSTKAYFCLNWKQFICPLVMETYLFPEHEHLHTCTRMEYKRMHLWKTQSTRKFSQKSIQIIEYLIMKLSLILLGIIALAAAEVQFQNPEEWQLWKAQHGKSYQSQREELDRHLIWLANREYINGHNKNAHIFGFTLAMNHLGDIVKPVASVKDVVFRVS